MASDIHARLGGARSSLAFKAPVRCATTANITLSGFQTIDGITPASGDTNLRILVKDQTNAVTNGIYEMSSGAWSRARDFDGSDDIVKGTRVHVANGTVNGSTAWILSTADPITIDTSSLSFSASSSETSVTPTGATTARSLASRFSDILSVKDFGAVGDGSTDDTTALNAAVAATKSAGVPLFFPAGTYLTSSGLALHDNAHWFGAGSTRSIIKLKNSSNTSVVYGEQVAMLFGTAGGAGDDDWTMADLGIDGNKTNNTSGHGIYVYGRRYRLHNVDIKNCASDGIRTDFNESFDAFGPRAALTNVYIDNCNNHGFWSTGPSDSSLVNVDIVDCGGAANNSYYGFYLGAGGNVRGVNCHAHHRSSASNRMAAALYVDGSSGSDFATSHFEGAHTNIVLDGTANTIDGCWVYNSCGGKNIIIRESYQRINCWLGGPLSGSADVMGIQLGVAAGDTVAYCVINCTGESQRAGFVDFTYDDGYNFVQIVGVNSVSGTNVVGTPVSTDVVRIAITGASTTDLTSGYIIGLTTSVSGTLPVANGGTGAATLTGIVKGNGTSPMTAVTAPSGTIVGTSDTQTLTGKTIDGNSNTLTVLAATQMSGTLPVANGGTGAATLTGIVKGNGTSPMTAVTAPSGTIVGTSDTQTLTGKTIDGNSNTLTVLAGSQISGTLAVANGGTGDTGTAWSSWSPTVTSSGTLPTTATTSARYKQIGKTIWFQISYDVAVLGAGTGNISFTIPTGTLAATIPVLGYNNAAGTYQVSVASTASGQITMIPSPALAAQSYYIGGVFEIA